MRLVAPTDSVRSARPGDERAIRHVFQSTLALGRRVIVGGMDAYTAFALDWYLSADDASVAVHEHAGVVDGYVLVCTDEDAFERWQKRSAARYARSLAGLAVRGRLRGDTWQFHRLRIRDGLQLRSSETSRPAPAHIHLNLLPGARAARAGRDLVAVADSVVGDAGLDAWYAHINAPVGQRARALERLGADVLHRSVNQTLSHLVGMPVERLTILRRL